MAKAKVPAAYYVREWYEKSEIDYFSAFVKAYIPFNAWMNSQYPNEQQDRAKINLVKKSSNTFRMRLVALLNMPNQEGESFRGVVGALHDALEQSALINNDEKISFTDVVFERNKKADEEITRNGIKYHAHYDDSTQKTILTIFNRKGARTLCAQFDGFPTEKDIRANDDVKALTAEKSSILVNVYKEVNPLIRGSLLADDAKKSISCGAYRMIKDVDLLSAGIIEVLYNLRNALFHGVINPTKAVNTVYGEAYRIMHTLVRALA